MTRHYPDLGSASDWLKQISYPTNTRPIKRTTHIWVSDSLSVQNFCARLSDVISPGNHWWRHKMSTILSGYSFSFRVFFPLLSSFLHQLPRLGTNLHLPSMANAQRKNSFISEIILCIHVITQKSSSQSSVETRLDIRVLANNSRPHTPFWLDDNPAGRIGGLISLFYLRPSASRCDRI